MQKVARLIETFAPNHYDLSLSIDRPARTFQGTVQIGGIAKTKAIRLHSKGLDIKAVEVDGEKSTFELTDQDQLSISAKKSGEHTVTVKFSGKITDPMHGMYPCYFKHDGKDKELIATQFESHHAREVFPCVDEPEAKATFDLTLETEAKITVLGNMPVASQNTLGSRMTTTFETTPRMSSYLLAWVYGELHSKSTKTKRGVEVSVWATPAQKNSSFNFALDVAKRAIEFYEDYFGHAYPLPKSDHIALPDFSSGAMENWGLITYRESALLTPPETTSLESHKLVAKIISHELAHQWFGNLVTMKWWDDLWLNESFANMIEYLVVDRLFPDWDMWLEFATSESVYALRRDAIDGVQPVKIDVYHPDEITSLFDPYIVYAKGSKLIKMLLSYVGEDAFRDGLKQYFQDYAYSNTSGKDLWNALAKSSGKNVAKFMDAWLEQPGYPIVNVSRKDSEITLTQKQFFVGPHGKSDRVWPIPLDATCSKLPKILKERSKKVSRPYKNQVLLNKYDNGHFITEYSEDLLKQILSSVAGGKLSSTQRFQLLNDSILLARGNQIPSAKLLDIVTAYQNETTHQVWDGIFMALAELRKFVENNKPAEDKLRQLSFDIAKQHYQKLGWHKKPGEDENDSLLRVTILALAVYSQKPEIINEAKQIYESTPIEKIDPEIRTLVLSAVSRHGSDEIIDGLLKEYGTTNLANLRDDICAGITSTKSPDKIKLLLESLKDSRTIRPQDVSRWYVQLVRSREARTLAWQWLQDNWLWIKQNFGSDKSYDDFPSYTAIALSTRQQLQEYKTFFTPMKKEPALTRAIDMGISEIEGRVELIERESPAVQAALLNL